MSQGRRLVKFSGEDVAHLQPVRAGDLARLSRTESPGRDARRRVIAPQSEAGGSLARRSLAARMVIHE